MANAASLLESIGQARRSLAAQPHTRARLAQLQSWQLARLRRTYADYAAQARYRDALAFFVGDLYGPHDDASRDRELGRVLGLFEKLLSVRALHALTTALELEALSQSLDLAMLDAFKTGATQPITELSYAKAYRDADRRADRQRQIALIVAAGRALDKIVDNAAIGAALRATRWPARRLGVGVLQDFLERGYHAFARMQGAEPLLAAIEQRETVIMRNLFAGSSEPFKWERT